MQYIQNTKQKISLSAVEMERGMSSIKSQLPGLSFAVKVSRFTRFVVAIVAIVSSIGLAGHAQTTEKNTFSGKQVKGAEILQLGLSTVSILNGGASIGLLGGADVLLDDPASAARNLQNSFLLQSTGMNETRTGIILGYAHVTEYGVFSGYAHVFMGYTKGYEMGGIYSFSLAFSKLISTIYEFGFRLTGDYFEPRSYETTDNYKTRDTLNSFGISGDISFNVQPRFDFQKGVFSFRNFRYGFTIRNAGWLPQLRGDKNEVAYVKKMDLFRMGGGVDFITVYDEMRKPFYVARIVFEGGLSYPIAGTFGAGLENKFFIEDYGVRSVSLHLGYLYDTSIDTVFPLIPGLSISFYVEDVEIALRNAIVIQKSPTTDKYEDLAASLSLEVKFGKLDADAPEIDTDFFGTEGLIEN